MPAVLELDNRRPITYSSALRKDENIINKVAYGAAQAKLYQDLWAKRDSIEGLVRHHLKAGKQDICVVQPESQWIRGNFNVCIPVQLQSNGSMKKLMFRCAMPHKLAEARYPGTVDEKLRCEVATYAWLHARCSDIRIPHLYGFGFCDNRHFIHERQQPFYIRLWRLFQRSLRRAFRYPILSCYLATSTHDHLPTAYMLLEYIDSTTGQMLSNTWDLHRNDQTRRTRLFRGMAHIISSLARIPQPRIASFDLNSDGTITLTSRPQICSIIMLENEGAHRTIQRNETYTSIEPFVADMLSLHDNSFLSDPNAVYSATDCRGQMAARVLLKALSHHFIRREGRFGPFRLQLTDFHASNIFVDEDWNITCLIDLEWICALPIDMLSVPYWLSGRGIDELEGENLQEFEVIRREFMQALREEECIMVSSQNDMVARHIDDSWRSGAFWFWRCLTSINAMYAIIEEHICPRFSSLSSAAEHTLSCYWCVGSDEVVKSKVAEHEEYKKDLQVLYDRTSI